jgi:hypothetical protein
MSDVLTRLRAMQAGDVPVTGGRTLAYVYDSGLEEADRVGREAVAAYAGSNGLDPTAFPSLLAMENELVGFAADLLDGPPTTVGTVTSGGTESVLLAVQGARDSRPDVDRPRMVLPVTAHAAFHKAAHYFGVEPGAGSAVTSTPASAGGCCRTPPGSAARSRRGRSRSTGSPASRSTCTSTPTPRRAPRSCCTGPRSCGGRSTSPAPGGPGTRC